MRVRIGIDVDGVLYDWESQARLLLNERWGYELPQPQYWTDIRDRVEKEHWQWLWTGGVEKHGLFRHGGIYPGVVEGLRILANLDHNLVLITSRPKSAALDTFEWVAFHRLPVSAVHVLGPHQKKSQVVCDAYVDDHLDHVRELAGKGRVFLWDRPWNQAEPIEGVERISRWSELLKWVGK